MPNNCMWIVSYLVDLQLKASGGLNSKYVPSRRVSLDTGMDITSKIAER